MKDQAEIGTIIEAPRGNNEPIVLAKVLHSPQYLKRAANRQDLSDDSDAEAVAEAVAEMALKRVTKKKKKRSKRHTVEKDGDGDHVEGSGGTDAEVQVKKVGKKKKRLRGHVVEEVNDGDHAGGAGGDIGTEVQVQEVRKDVSKVGPEEDVDRRVVEEDNDHAGGAGGGKDVEVQVREVRCLGGNSMTDAHHLKPHVSPGATRVIAKGPVLQSEKSDVDEPPKKRARVEKEGSIRKKNGPTARPAFAQKKGEKRKRNI